MLCLRAPLKTFLFITSTLSLLHSEKGEIEFLEAPYCFVFDFEVGHANILAVLLTLSAGLMTLLATIIAWVIVNKKSKS